MRQMQDNLNKASQRGDRLDALQDKTDNLATSAQGFRRGANRVRKQMWWKDMKMRICIVVGIIILLVIIIVPSGKQQPWRIPKRGNITRQTRATPETDMFSSHCYQEQLSARALFTTLLHKSDRDRAS